MTPALRELLERLEWAGFEPADEYAARAGYAMCPDCGQREEAGHNPGCALAAALAETPAVPDVVVTVNAGRNEQALRSLREYAAELPAKRHAWKLRGEPDDPRRAWEFDLGVVGCLGVRRWPHPLTERPWFADVVLGSTGRAVIDIGQYADENEAKRAAIGWAHVHLRAALDAIASEDGQAP